MNMDSENESAAKPLRQRLKEATSEAILEAAEEAFAGAGLHGARMEDVAARAGVSVGTLYNYFSDRAGLLAALLESRRADLVGSLDRSLSETASRPFDARLAGVLQSLLAHFEAHRPFFSILMQAEHTKDASLFPATQRPRETMMLVYERLRTLIEQGVEQGALRADSADLLPALLIGMVRGVLIRTLYETERSTPVTDRVADVVRFFLEGAGAHA